MEELASHEFKGEIQLLDEGSYGLGKFHFVMLVAEDADPRYLDYAARAVAVLIASERKDSSFN